MTKAFDASIEMENLINKYGITAVTSALVDEVKRRDNWRQMDTLKNVLNEKGVY